MDTFYNAVDMVVNLVEDRPRFCRSTLVLVNNGEERTREHARSATAYGGWHHEKKWMCYPDSRMLDVYAAAFFGGNENAALTAYRAFAEASDAGYDHWKH